MSSASAPCPGGVLGQRLRLEQRLRAGSRHNDHALLRHLHGEVNETIPLVNAQRCRLGRGAVHEKPVRAVLDMELDDPCVSVVVYLAFSKRSDERWKGSLQPIDIRHRELLSS